MRGKRLSSYFRQQIKLAQPQHRVQEGHTNGMLYHTEMHSDNRMRKRRAVRGWGWGERKKKEWGMWKGGKNEPEKLLGKVKKTK